MSRATKQIGNTERLRVEPIRLSPPDPQRVSEARSRVHAPNENATLILGLSQEPPPAWRSVFYRCWQLFFEGLAAPSFSKGQTVWIEAKPCQLDSYVEMTQFAITFANLVSAPLIRWHDAVARADKQRTERRREIEREQAQRPSGLNFDARHYYRDLGALRAAQQKERNDLEAEVARREFDDSMSRLADYFIDSAVTTIDNITRETNVA
jgi:hypothetical protein